MPLHRWSNASTTIFWNLGDESIKVPARDPCEILLRKYLADAHAAVPRRSPCNN
jgi:hypothetical protein